MHVKSALEDVQGVTSVDVDLLKKRAVVEGTELSDAALSSAVAEAGYSVSGIIGNR
jgi:copper chaperone CopZ